MLLYAYRRTPKIPGDWSAEDSRTHCIASLDTDTRVLQMLTKDEVAVAEPTSWRYMTGTAEEEFLGWVHMYHDIWSLNPADAFWMKDTYIDEGL